ncbi:VirC2 family conjugal transfer protein [Sinorhizobium sp. Sb3]|uniref:VirC2 family conjugal transfer protein n=1 Tax=Sinorhizobium sp. Sb3 TaxID=1358417 RepID=UPI0009E8021C|nr:VirC2 family conjugal transfer protein [Sinorhizobium sp. Sb3]
MGIRKPSLTVSEARRLAEERSTPEKSPSTGERAPPSTRTVVPPPLPSPAPPTESGLTGATSAATKDDAPRADGEWQAVGKREAAVPSTKGLIKQEPFLQSLLPSRAEKTQVFISALLPAANVSPIYETLCRQYPPQKALQMVLRRALHEYESMLEDGTFRNGPQYYPTNPATRLDEFVQTSRMMPKVLLGIARAHFDPLGLESTRSFGRKLANAALASFFARESGKKASGR